MSRVRCRNKGRNGHQSFDSTPHEIAYVNLHVAIKRSHLDDGHSAIAGKYHGRRIAIDRWEVSKVLRITAHKVVVRLHDENINSGALHRFTYGGPASL